MLVKQYSDASYMPLQGILNGVNRRFRVDYTINQDYVSVLVNGTPMAPDVVNGWHVVDAFTVELNEAPLASDTVAVEYLTGAVAGGGGPGGPAGTPSVVVAGEARPAVVVTIAANDRPGLQVACVCQDCATPRG